MTLRSSCDPGQQRALQQNKTTTALGMLTTLSGLTSQKPYWLSSDSYNRPRLGQPGSLHIYFHMPAGVGSHGRRSAGR